MTHHALRRESQRIGWPIVFRADVALDVMELTANPEPYRCGFGWLLTETSTHLVPPAPGAASVIEDLSTAYPQGRWYFVNGPGLSVTTAVELIERLESLRLGAAA